MGVDECFEIAEKHRIAFIEGILVVLPEEVQEQAQSRINELVNNCKGVDRDVLSILMYAAERGKFDEYAAKLEKHYEENISLMHPEARRNDDIPGAVRAAHFFSECYKEMGIKPQKD